MRLSAALLALVAGAAGAAERVPPAVFEAETEGRTLIFEIRGAPHGAEQYLPDRRVIWQEPDGTCRPGLWEAEGPDLCFVYDDRPGERGCWEVWRDAEGLFARQRGDGPGANLRVVGASDRPLSCGGIDAGS